MAEPIGWRRIMTANATSPAIGTATADGWSMITTGITITTVIATAFMATITTTTTTITRS